MHLTTSICTALLLASSALAQTQDQSQCITTCVTNNLRSSWCDGNETGEALADCTCASYQGPSDPLIVCVKSCPAADVAQFAANIPAKCRGTLFPGVTVAPGSGGAVATQTESSSSSATTSESATGGMTTATSTTTHATTTTTPATAASSTHTGLAAVNQPAGIVMAIGVLAAFAI